MRSASANSARNGAWSRSSGTRSATTTLATGRTAPATATSRRGCSGAGSSAEATATASSPGRSAKLDKAASLGGSKTLYDANRETYERLRYGVKVQPAVGEQTVTVWLIDWENPADNDFAIAEEVTVAGRNTKRPDLVLYVNGIALGVLELKRSTVSVSQGIHQNLDNQKPEFIRPFFTTVQLVMAGNETEGLRYGVVETPEKYWLRWKEAEAHPAAGDNPLLQELGQRGLSAEWSGAGGRAAPPR